ncbi:AAA family ATPase [Sphingomonas sp. PB4P5]|uniref:AAA family ATPase n=1 Tax=Parasphingomonas puruogangriensis TaxID=3096155 RepID=UPI002FC6E91C
MSGVEDQPVDFVETVAALNAHIDRLSSRFVARRAVLELIMLGLVAREHVLLIGPPGTGKSAAVQAVAGAIDATTFEYLLGRFTEPSELFGALDLNALKDGRVEPVTAGMLRGRVPRRNLSRIDRHPQHAAQDSQRAHLSSRAV